MKPLFFALALAFVTPAWGQAIVLSACGTANYTAQIGSLHQLTMNPTGYLCVSTTTMRSQEEAPAGKPVEAPGAALSPPPQPDASKLPAPLPEPKK